MKFLMKKFAMHKKLFAVFALTLLFLSLGFLSMVSHVPTAHAQQPSISDLQKKVNDAKATLASDTNAGNEGAIAADITNLDAANAALAKAQGAAPPAPTVSGDSSNGSILNPLTWIIAAVNGIANLISFLLSAFISLAGYLLNVVLSLSATLVQSTVVQTGFSICLALANLGLVVAALFMAVATIGQDIIGNDTFGIKKGIPKLILVAVFVNFLLVGAGLVIKASDGASFYFASQASPGTGGAASFGAFATKLAGAFQPQSLYNVTDMNGAANGFAAQVSGTGISQTFQSILNILFVVVFELFIFIVLLLAAVMFLIRYIYLGVLLIVAPLALLTYLFPSLSSHWKGWCTKFLHWTMFGPLMMLGLYLAILAAQTRGKWLDPPVQQNVNDPVGAVQALRVQANRQPGFWQSLTEMMMILGIAGGGIMMANSFAPKFAGATMTGAQNLGKRAKGYLGGQARTRAARLATRPLATQGAQDRFSGWQGSSNIAKRWTGRLLQGIGTGGQRAGEKDAQAWAAGRTNKQLVDNYSTMNEAQKIASLERMRKEGILSQLPMDALSKDLPKLKAAFERRGALSTFDAINKESGNALLSSSGNDEDLKKAASGVSMPGLAATAFLNREKALEEGVKVGITKAQQEEMQEKLMKSLLLLGDPSKLAAAAQAASNAGQLDVFKKVLGGVASGLAIRAQKGEINPEQQKAILEYLKGNPARTLGLSEDDIKPLADVIKTQAAQTTNPTTTSSIIPPNSSSTQPIAPSQPPSQPTPSGGAHKTPPQQVTQQVQVPVMAGTP